MSADAAAPATAGWRKRHPVLARLLLYGLGGGILAVVAVLLVDRLRVDREDQWSALEKRLLSMDLVLAYPGGHKEVLATLDRDYADPALPAGLKHRALRMRALAHERGENLAGAEAAFAAAEPLSPSPRDRAALLVEWAEARAYLGNPESALTLLDRPDAASDGAVALLHARVRAFALGKLGREAEAARVLEAALRALPEPMPQGPSDHVGLRDWTPAEAAEEVRRGQIPASGEAPASPAAPLHEVLKSSPGSGR